MTVLTPILMKEDEARTLLCGADQRERDAIEQAARVVAEWYTDKPWTQLPENTRHAWRRDAEMIVAAYRRAKRKSANGKAKLDATP